MAEKIITKKEIIKALSQIRFCKEFLGNSFFGYAVDIEIYQETKNKLTTKFKTKDRICDIAISSFFNKSIITKIGNLLLISQLILMVFFGKQNLALAFDKPIEQNYFASLRSTETNVRAGPGSQYPIKFTFKLRGLPVKVISEYDNWNEIKDYEGETGWVNQNLVTKKRTAIVRTTKSFVNLYAKPSEKSKVLLRLENNVVGDFLKCGLEFCGIKVVGKKGWISKKEIWGIDENDIAKQEN